MPDNENLKNSPRWPLLIQKCIAFTTIRQFQAQRKRSLPPLRASRPAKTRGSSQPCSALHLGLRDRHLR
jgi:hypothetical protein